MTMTVRDIHMHIMKQGSKNLYRLQIIEDDISINMAEEDPGYTVRLRMIGFLTVSEEIQVLHESYGHIGQKGFIRLMK